MGKLSSVWKTFRYSSQELSQAAAGSRVLGALVVPDDDRLLLVGGIRGERTASGDQGDMDAIAAIAAGTGSGRTRARSSIGHTKGSARRYRSAGPLGAPPWQALDQRLCRARVGMVSSSRDRQDGRPRGSATGRTGALRDRQPTPALRKIPPSTTSVWPVIQSGLVGGEERGRAADVPGHAEPAAAGSAAAASSSRPSYRACGELRLHHGRARSR